MKRINIVFILSGVLLFMLAMARCNSRNEISLSYEIESIHSHKDSVLSLVDSVLVGVEHRQESYVEALDSLSVIATENKFNEDEFHDLQRKYNDIRESLESVRTSEIAIIEESLDVEMAAMAPEVVDSIVYNIVEVDSFVYNIIVVDSIVYEYDTIKKKKKRRR